AFLMFLIFGFADHALICLAPRNPLAFRSTPPSGQLHYRFDDAGQTGEPVQRQHRAADWLPGVAGWYVPDAVQSPNGSTGNSSFRVVSPGIPVQLGHDYSDGDRCGMLPTGI